MNAKRRKFNSTQLLYCPAGQPWVLGHWNANLDPALHRGKNLRHAPMLLIPLRKRNLIWRTQYLLLLVEILLSLKQIFC